MVPFRTLVKIRVLIIAALTLSLLPSTALASQLDAKRKELNSVKTKIEQNKRAIQAVKKRQQDVLGEIAANDRVIAKLQKEINDLQAEIRRSTVKRQRSEAQLVRMKAQLKATEAKLSVTERKLAFKREVYDRRLSGLYKSSSAVSVIDLLLNSRDFANLVERTALLAKIAENDAKLVHDMKQTRQGIVVDLKRIAVQKKAVNKQYLTVIDEENHLKAVKVRVATRQDLFERELKRQKQILARVQSNKQQLARAEDMLDSTSKLIAGQIRTLERGGSLKTSRGYARAANGRMTWPVNSTITSRFGWRVHPVLGYKRFHSGIDLRAPYGKTIHAAQSGTVILAGWMGGYGNAVVISHGGGVSTLYGHNSRLYVRTGERIATGQPIAAAGSTGLSTGPHLHFEVRINGNPQNPMNWL